LVVLFDYDKCLVDVLKSDTKDVLKEFVGKKISETAHKHRLRNVVLLSYSNRICETYSRINDRKDPRVRDSSDTKEYRPTKDAIETMARWLREYKELEDFKIEGRHGLKDPTENGGYLINGDEYFAGQFGADWKTTVNREKLKEHVSEESEGPSIKQQLFEAARIDNSEPGTHFLLFDDKWENLEYALKYTNTDVLNLVGYSFFTQVRVTRDKERAYNLEYNTKWAPLTSYY